MVHKFESDNPESVNINLNNFIETKKPFGPLLLTQYLPLPTKECWERQHGYLSFWTVLQLSKSRQGGWGCALPTFNLDFIWATHLVPWKRAETGSTDCEAKATLTNDSVKYNLSQRRKMVFHLCYCLTGPLPKKSPTYWSLDIFIGRVG